MDRAWRVLDFSQAAGKLGYERGKLVFESKDGESHQIPLVDVAVVLLGLRVSLSGGAFHQMMGDAVALIPCDWKGLPVGAAHGWATHTRVGARQLAQRDLTIPRAKNAWGRIIKAKIRGQAMTLKRLGIDPGTYLNKLAADVRSGDVGNTEALAARWYWARYFQIEPYSRSPRGGGRLNALLDYGYTVLRGHALRAVVGAGLHPGFGVFHRGRSNQFALADDVIEPFRPAIDYVVRQFPDDATIAHPAVKHALVAASNQVFDDTGWTIPTALDALAQQFGRYVEHDIDRLPVPQWLAPEQSAEVFR